MRSNMPAPMSRSIVIGSTPSAAGWIGNFDQNHSDVNLFSPPASVRAGRLSMDRILEIREQIIRSRRLPALVIGLTLCILGLTIGWSCLHLREKIRAQIANHDGEILH